MADGRPSRSTPDILGTSADTAQAPDIGFGERPASIGNPKVGIRDPEADPVSVAFFAGHGVIGVLKQFVEKPALVVMGDLGFLAGVLTKPDRARTVDVERLIADALKQGIPIPSQS
jgi:hypothetical protein